jgi:glycosyltransferase involved in cell wall biosynthesis
MNQNLKLPLSVAIITFNEESNIARCIESVKEIADEILVLDSFSTDKTKEICERYPSVRFAQHAFDGHIEQKNRALSLCLYDHVLSLDADEALDEKLRAEILRLKESWPNEAPEIKGFMFYRLNHYVDQWVYHCGWYPDRKLRLLDRRCGKWTGKNPHDIIALKDAQYKVIPGNILHYSYDSIADHITQTNKFTTIAAKAAYQSGVRSSTFKIITRPLLKFFKDYFLKRGFLDGSYGFVICFINALSALLKYSKLKDLQEGKDITLKQNR